MLNGEVYTKTEVHNQSDSKQNFQLCCSVVIVELSLEADNTISWQPSKFKLTSDLVGCTQCFEIVIHLRQ